MTLPPFTLHRGDAHNIDLGIRHLVGNSDPAYDAFMSFATSAKIDLSQQVIAAGPTGIIIAVCLWVSSPGKTAMFFLSPAQTTPQFSTAATACVTAAIADASARGTVIVQVLFDPADQIVNAIYTTAGLTPLATLTYMERRPPTTAPPVTFPDHITLHPYSAENHALFREAILGSYIETRDCPALSNLRDVEDVILGHQAVGPFEPNLWSVALDGATPIGCILLSDIPQRSSLEVVYLGLTPLGRGRGIARALLLRALGIAARRHFQLLTLAVDAGNTPALKLYRRMGFVRTADRSAMIRKIN